MSTSVKLGRGLDALLGTMASESGVSENNQIQLVDIENLKPGPYQPRTQFNEDSLRELADSIAAHGIIQPIVVKASQGGLYDIITGERRWRAAQIAAQHSVPVIVRSIPDQDAMALALIENIQREDLNVTEVASMLKRLIDEFGLKHAEIAKSVGLSRASVTNLLRLLTLTEPVFELLAQGKLETGHAKALLALSGQSQIDAANHVVAHALSVRRTEALVKSWKKPVSTRQQPSSDANIVNLERRLCEKLTAKVTIHDRNGKGHIKINYQNLDELEGVLERIG